MSWPLKDKKTGWPTTDIELPGECNMYWVCTKHVRSTTELPKGLAAIPLRPLHIVSNHPSTTRYYQASILFVLFLGSSLVICGSICSNSWTTLNLWEMFCDTSSLQRVQWFDLIWYGWTTPILWEIINVILVPSLASWFRQVLARNT